MDIENLTEEEEGGWNYPNSEIPAWCRLPLTDHHDGLGGCWGISHGLVKKTGGTHCKGCDSCDEETFQPTS